MGAFGGTLVGVPLAMQVIHRLETEYSGRIPLAAAESTLQDTNGVLLHGRSIDFILDKLQRFGMIAIEGGFVLPTRSIGRDTGDSHLLTLGDH